MGDDPHARPRSLPMLILALRDAGEWPPRDGAVRETERRLGFSPEVAERVHELAARTRSAIETYLGLEVGDDRVIGRLYGRLQVDFGIGPGDADRLDMVQLTFLLLNWMRCKASTGVAVQDLLRHVARYRRLEAGTQSTPDSIPAFLKALAAFPAPDPEPTGANQPAASSSEAPPEPPAASGGEAPGRDARSASVPPNPGCNALAAAYELLTEGRPVTLAAACKRAGVCRKNVAQNYHGVAEVIRGMGTPDRTPRRATRDRRTGNLDAVDGGDD